MSFKLPAKEGLDVRTTTMVVIVSNFFEPIAVITPMESPEKRKYTQIEISNLPKNVEVADKLKMWKTKVNKRFIEKDIQVYDKRHTNVKAFIGPGPNLEILQSSVNILGYRKSGSEASLGRQIKVKLHRLLTPNEDDEAAKPPENRNTSRRC